MLALRRKIVEKLLSIRPVRTHVLKGQEEHRGDCESLVDTTDRLNVKVVLIPDEREQIEDGIEYRQVDYPDNLPLFLRRRVSMNMLPAEEKAAEDSEYSACRGNVYHELVECDAAAAEERDSNIICQWFGTYGAQFAAAAGVIQTWLEHG